MTVLALPLVFALLGLGPIVAAVYLAVVLQSRR